MNSFAPRASLTALGDTWVRFWFPATTAVPLAVCRLVLAPAWLLIFAGSPDDYAVALTYDPERIDQALIRLVLVFVPVEIFHTEQFLRGVWLAATAVRRAGDHRLLHAHRAPDARAGLLDPDRPPLLVWRAAPSRGAVLHRDRAAGAVAVRSLLLRRFVARQAVEASPWLGARRPHRIPRRGPCG